MEYRQLGKSGLRIPVLSYGTATFGGTTDFFKKWGEVDSKQASRLVSICIENGINFFDTANVYSAGASEKILGDAIKGRRDQTIIATKATFSMGERANDRGASRYHIIRECEASLKRLGTDFIDLYFIHGFDPLTPVEETLSALDDLIKSGKIRYIGCSNFASWQVQKALGVAEKHQLHKYVVYQGYYSLLGRDIEWELSPMLQDQGLGFMAWSPLGWGRLTGKMKRGEMIGSGRIKEGGATGGPEVDEDLTYNVVDLLEQIAEETGKSDPQIAINWLIQKNHVCNVVIGARNEKQLIENIGAVGWRLSQEHTLQLDKATAQKAMYPHWVGMR